MDTENFAWDAHLRSNNAEAAIKAKCASRYSLFIEFKEKNIFQPDEELKLFLKLNGDIHELGPCRLIDGTDDDVFTQRLIGTREIFDFENLFRNHKLINLQDAFHELPMALARKEMVRQCFKEFTGNLVYDMSLYQHFFEQVDARCKSEAPKIITEIQSAIINTTGKDFLHFFNQKLDELADLVSDFSEEEHYIHCFYFRKHMHRYIFMAPFTERCITKPRGYSGDFESMRMIYANDYQGDSIMGKLLHKNCVGHRSCQSVRERISLVSEILYNFEQKQTPRPNEKINILSVGCGPAEEIKNIIKTSADTQKYRISLLDQDPAALEAATRTISGVEQKVGSKISAEYLECSVRTMLFSRRLKRKWGQFDFIYSLGLFDYLAERVAKAVMKRLFDLLVPGGEMLAGNFHVNNPARWYMTYWADWPLIYRTEKQFLSLFPNEGQASVKLFYEKAGCQMFLHIKKPTTYPTLYS